MGLGGDARPFPKSPLELESALEIHSTQEYGLRKTLHEEAASQGKMYVFISRPQARHCKAGPGTAHSCGLHAWPRHLATSGEAGFLELEAGEGHGEDFSTSGQATQPPGPKAAPLSFRLWCPMSLAGRHFTCRRQRPREWGWGSPGVVCHPLLAARQPTLNRVTVVL